MKKSLPLLLALLSVFLSVPALSGSGPTPAPQTNVVTFTVSPDGGPLTWYVDVRGSDLNTCTAPFTDGGKNGPCRQPKAAVTKIPKQLRHQATVSMDAGVYEAFIVTGFEYDYGAQGQNGGLLFDGVRVTSTLASGPATGTATSGTAGSGTTFGTLTMTGAGWTTNDLTGRFVTTASPTNAQFVVSSNTSDTITVVGTWSAPTGSTTFTIEDSATEWTGNILAVIPATATQAAITGRSMIFVSGNNLDWSNSAITFRNMRFTNDAGVAMEFTDRSGIQLVNVQVMNTGGLNAAMFVGNARTGGGNLTISKSYLSPPNNTNGTIAPTSGSLTIQNSLIRANAGSNPALNLNNGVGTAQFGFISNSEFRGNSSAVAAGAHFNGFQTFSNLRISCTAAGGVGLRLGSNTTTSMVGGSSLDGIGPIDFSGCSTAVQIRGMNVINFSGALTGSALSTGVEVIGGGTFAYTKSSVTLDAGSGAGVDISLDPASIVPVTSTFSGIVANSCVATAAAGYYSKACAR